MLVPSARWRDFNYPGAVQDLETLSSGGEIRNIPGQARPGSSHCWGLNYHIETISVLGHSVRHA